MLYIPYLHNVRTVGSSYSYTFRFCFFLQTMFRFRSYLFALDEEGLTGKCMFKFRSYLFAVDEEGLTGNACRCYVSPYITEAATIEARYTSVGSTILFHRTHVMSHLL